VRRKEGELTQRLTVRETRERRTVSFRRPAATALESTGRDGAQDQAQRIREMERRLRHLVDQHDQRLERARQNLERLEESLGPRHPDLQAARREVEDARPIPGEITKLKTQIANARARLPSPQSSAAPSGARFEVVQMPLSEDVYNALQADPEVGHMMEEVNKYATEYGAQLDRLEAAELEIEMSNAAFAYRYTVTQPPTYPTKPVSSKRKLVLMAGVFLGILVALAACLIWDLASGRVRARWQVERLLGVPVLGEVRLDD
jgi:chromosome segregation ATPase